MRAYVRLRRGLDAVTGEDTAVQDAATVAAAGRSNSFDVVPPGFVVTSTAWLTGLIAIDTPDSSPAETSPKVGGKHTSPFHV